MIVNWLDTPFFHANLTPEKGAIASGGTAISYGRLAHAILSVERRINAAQVKLGDIVTLQIDAPIRHFILAYALHRLNIASLSLNSTELDLLPKIGSTIILTDKLLSPKMASALGRTRMIIVEDSWFDEKSALEWTAVDMGDLQQTNRIVISRQISGEPALTKVPRISIQLQLVADYLSVGHGWDRLLCLPDLSTHLGFRTVFLALWLGRGISFAGVENACQLMSTFQHEFLVATVEQAEALIEQQQNSYISSLSLRGAHVSGHVFSSSFLTRFQTIFSNNLTCSYGDPHVGTIAYALANRIKEIEGAVGFVAPWIDLQIVNDNNEILQSEQQGKIRVRFLSDSLLTGNTSVRNPTEGESGWIYTGHSGRLLKNNMLVISAPQAS